MKRTILFSSGIANISVPTTLNLVDHPSRSISKMLSPTRSVPSHYPALDYTPVRDEVLKQVATAYCGAWSHQVMPTNFAQNVKSPGSTNDCPYWAILQGKVGLTLLPV